MPQESIRCCASWLSPRAWNFRHTTTPIKAAAIAPIATPITAKVVPVPTRQRRYGLMYVKFLGRQRKVNALTDNYLRWNTKITRASRDKRNNLDTAWSISNTILRVVFDNGFFLNEIDRLYYVKFDLCTLKLITYYFTCKQDFFLYD